MFLGTWNMPKSKQRESTDHKPYIDINIHRNIDIFIFYIRYLKIISNWIKKFKRNAFLISVFTCDKAVDINIEDLRQQLLKHGISARRKIEFITRNTQQNYKIGPSFSPVSHASFVNRRE